MAGGIISQDEKNPLGEVRDRLTLAETGADEQATAQLAKPSPGPAYARRPAGGPGRRRRRHPPERVVGGTPTVAALLGRAAEPERGPGHPGPISADWRRCREDRMKGLDWDYIVEILEDATEGGTGCSYTLFSVGESQRLLDEKTLSLYGGLTAEESKEHTEALRKFHTHTGVLSDLNWIETWDNPTSMPEAAIRLHGSCLPRSSGQSESLRKAMRSSRPWKRTRENKGIS